MQNTGSSSVQSNGAAKSQPSREQLYRLLRRVEAASGADRALDGHIYGTLGFQIIQRWGGYEWRPEGRGVWLTMPSPTASLDAALALVERVAPGMFWRAWEVLPSDIGLDADYAASVGYLGEQELATAKTPALALLAALLKALSHQQPRDQQVAGEGSREDPK